MLAQTTLKNKENQIENAKLKSASFVQTRKVAPSDYIASQHQRNKSDSKMYMN